MKRLTQQTLIIYWQHIRRYRGSFFAILFSIVSAVVFSSYIPFLYKRLFDGLTSNLPFRQLVNILLLVLLFNFLQWLGWRIATFVNNFFQPRVKSDLLNTCFDYIQGHSYSFFSNRFTGSLVKKASRFERAFEDITDKLEWSLGPTALRLIIVIVVLFFYNHILGYVMFFWTAAYVWFALWFSKFKLKYDIVVTEADSKVSGYLTDTITNNVTIKLFGGHKYEYSAFKKLTDYLFRVKKHSWDLAIISESVQTGLLVVLEFAVIFAAIHLWAKGQITVGGIVLLQVYIGQIFGSVWDLGRFIRDVYERLADAEEMTEILTMPHSVANVLGAKKLVVQKGQIEFQSMSFGYYDSKPVFKKFNLTIRPGERVALIGPSGGGKTTVVKLLLRFFDLTGGKILIDGQEIASVTQESLRESLALVPQEPILFHRSLYDNIAYSRPGASEKEVMEAARLAHCHEFIMSFPEKYKTFVGERGVKLSGGERQRVAIARAILKNAPILVLDEATSSLDSESEMLIQDALKNLMKDKTTIVIAHRLSTIMQMDRIIVIEKGQIVEQGKHKELLKAKQGVYQKLWGIQAGSFAGE